MVEEGRGIGKKLSPDPGHESLIDPNENQLQWAGRTAHTDRYGFNSVGPERQGAQQNAPRIYQR